MKRLLFAIAFVGSLGFSSASAKADAESEARAHFEAGQAHVDARRFEEAYAEFAAGFAQSPRPLFLFNMAECARFAGRLEDARRDYERYLTADPNGPMATAAWRELEALGPTPAPAPALAVEPQSGQEPTVTLPSVSEVPPASSVTPLALTPPMERAEPPPPASREIWEEPAFWAILGTVVVAAVGAGIGIGIATSAGPSEPPCDAACMMVRF